MKRFLLSLSLFFSTSLLAGTARYIVLLRAPLPHARVRELNDVREFQTLDAFAANLDEKQIADLRASGNVRAIETIKERHISDPVERTRGSGQAGRARWGAGLGGDKVRTGGASWFAELRQGFSLCGHFALFAPLASRVV